MCINEWGPWDIFKIANSKTIPSYVICPSYEQIYYRHVTYVEPIKIL